MGVGAAAAGPDPEAASDAAAVSVTVLKTTCGTVTICVVMLPEVSVRVNVMTVLGISAGGVVGGGVSP